jgi:hypothetical protein
MPRSLHPCALHPCARRAQCADAALRARWGYAGPKKTAGGTPDVSSKIHVDGSRPLPDAALDVGRYANATVRAYFEAYEPRLNAFGYSFRAPFVTGCAMETRRALSCPALPVRADAAGAP